MEWGLEPGGMYKSSPLQTLLVNRKIGVCGQSSIAFDSLERDIFSKITMNESASESYVGIKDSGRSRIVREKSRFFGFAQCQTTEDEIERALDNIRDEHSDARHICYAYRLRSQEGRIIELYEDAGEPSRTAGFPILQLLEGRELQNVLVTVVRYYGGTKLGTGGLTRAYRDTAREAIEAAELEECYPTVRRKLSLSYAAFEKIKHHLDRDDMIDEWNAEFGAKVDVELCIRIGGLEALTERLEGYLNRAVEFQSP